MEPLEELQSLYEAYYPRFHAAEQKRRPGAGFMGMGGGPQDYPCHEQFTGELENFLQTTAVGLNPELTGQLLSYILFAPLDRQKDRDTVYWMLMAVHGFTLPLIPALTVKTAGELYRKYQEVYPERVLLPVHYKVLAALKERGKG